jgi:hypothetical protein
VQHLEARLLALAKRARQCKIDNKQEPMPPTLSEAETALVENFLQDILSIFPLVGLGVFEKTESTKKPADLLTIESGNIKASGYEDAKGFVVVKGSQLVKDETRSIHQFLSTLRKDLLAQGVIVAEGPHLCFHSGSCLQIALDGGRCRPGPDGKWTNRMEGQGREDPQTKSSRGNGGKGS